MDEQIDYSSYDDEFEGDIARVRAFVIKAHGSQKDKNGLPYITHLDAVARNTVRLFGFDKDLVLVAYLHDLVEDTKYRQADVDMTFPSHISDAVCAITKQNGEANHAYIDNLVKNNVIGAKVKLADLMHNTDEQRMAKLPEYTVRRLRKKYYPAIWRLCNAVGIEPWVSFEQAVEAIRDESSGTRQISVASLYKGDEFQFVENGDVFKVVKNTVVPATPGTSLRDVSVEGQERPLRIKATLKVHLQPRNAKIVEKAIEDYMGLVP